MSEVTRNRTIGILFFLSVLLILWQILFAPSLDEPMDLSTELPVAPVFKTYSIEKPEKSVEEILDRRQDPIIVETALEEKVATPQAPAEKPQLSSANKANNKTLLDSKSLPKHWSLRIASLRDASKVNTLRQRLEAAGYRHYTRNVTIKGKTYTRIYIGPKLKKADLAKVKSTVDKEFGVKSILVKYQSTGD